MSPTSIIILVLLGINTFIAVPYCILCVTEVYRFRSRNFLYHRRLSIFVMISTVTILGLLVSINLFGLSTIGILVIPSNFLIMMAILEFNTVTRLLLTRLWLLFFHNKYQEFLANKQWHSFLNPDAESQQTGFWFYKNRRKWGSAKYLLPRETITMQLLVNASICALLWVDFNVSMALEILWTVAFLVLLVAITVKVSPVSDVYNIRTELNEIVYLTVGIVLISVPVAVVSFLGKPLITRILGIVVCIIGHISLIHITTVRVLVKNLCEEELSWRTLSFSFYQPVVTSPSVTPRTQWKDWVIEPARFSAFMQYLAKSFACENLLFYSEVLACKESLDENFDNPFDFLEEPETLVDASAVVRTTRIYQKYCEMDAAKLEINVSYDCRKALREFFDDLDETMDDCDEVKEKLFDVFDDALKEVSSLLGTIFGSFQISEEFLAITRREEDVPIAGRMYSRLSMASLPTPKTSRAS